MGPLEITFTVLGSLAALFAAVRGLVRALRVLGQLEQALSVLFSLAEQFPDNGKTLTERLDGIEGEQCQMRRELKDILSRVA